MTKEEWIEAAREALKRFVIQQGDESIGNFTCCGNAEYRPHDKDCPVGKLLNTKTFDERSGP
jgi:hypothetical protein